MQADVIIGMNEVGWVTNNNDSADPEFLSIYEEGNIMKNKNTYLLFNVLSKLSKFYA